ncbi:unnamed protein product [Staurois parvus]|uniref:Uncharacterized protein n=1 Tax=Staurois parvus TaxID=386267 RepID=A0ABN9AMI4_9NEOB|nr:unnamed protein product [Staurois parvus]
MQTASTNVYERLCNRSICEISLLLNIPRSTVSGIISGSNWEQQQLCHKVVGQGSAYAEVHSAQKLPAVCKINS